MVSLEECLGSGDVGGQFNDDAIVPVKPVVALDVQELVMLFVQDFLFIFGQVVVHCKDSASSEEAVASEETEDVVHLNSHYANDAAVELHELHALVHRLSVLKLRISDFHESGITSTLLHCGQMRDAADVICFYAQDVERHLQFVTDEASFCSSCEHLAKTLDGGDGQMGILHVGFYN